MISIQLLDYVYTLGSLDFNKSIIGNLDVGSSENFPLALSFSISDIRSLDARTGTYSKTFKIPANKNNNKILKAAYYTESIIDGNEFSTKKDCRILVDNNYSITGKIQLTAIGKSSSPSYYSCVFYGNNIDWASSLNTKLLKDLSTQGGADGSGWDSLNGKTGYGIDLAINLADISSTWEVVDAENTQPSGGAVATNTSPVVYPIISYGEMNEGGIAATIQALKTCYEANGFGAGGYWGWDDSGNPYGTPEPSCDWRPCIFIYDIIKQIFSQEGYTIVSDFIETTMFKKLIMALPNFKYNNVIDRVNGNSWEGSFDSTGSGYADSFIVSGLTAWSGDGVWESVDQVIKWDDGGQLEENADYSGMTYDNTLGEFTVNEYGFYDISVENLSVWIESVCYLYPGTNTTGDVNLKYISLRCQVQTVGQTSWNNVGEINYLYGDDDNVTAFVACAPAPAFTFPFNSNMSEAISIENRYLNKGDKIKFVGRIRARQTSSAGATFGIETYIYGGDNSTGAPPSGVSTSGGLISIIHRGENAAYGQTYDLKNVIDSSSTQLGFLKGVSHAFNLQFITDTVSKTVEIEPFNDFYKNQKFAVDWTDKVDFSQIQEDKWIETELLREVIFKYKTDSEDKVVEARGIKYWDGILDEYPYREFLSNEFSVGKSIFENPFFAGTANVRNKESNQGWVQNAPWGAVLWGNCDTTPPTIPTGGSSCRPAKGYDFVPRLLNYTRLQCPTYVSTAIMLYAVIQTWIGTRTIWSAPVGGATSTIYPQANSYDRFDTTTPLLTYGSHSVSDRNCATGGESANIEVKGLYQTYYQNQIEMIKNTPRLKTINLNLKLSDIQTLDLRKLVYIDGSYYRINQVLDFQPNNNSPTKVELVLWEELGSLPAQGSF